MDSNEQVAPERIWVQLIKDTTLVAAYLQDPREIHDNGKPVYVYIPLDLHTAALREKDAEIEQMRSWCCLQEGRHICGTARTSEKS